MNPHETMQIFLSGTVIYLSHEKRPVMKHMKHKEFTGQNEELSIKCCDL